MDGDADASIDLTSVTQRMLMTLSSVPLERSQVAE